MCGVSNPQEVLTNMLVPMAAGGKLQKKNKQYSKYNTLFMEDADKVDRDRNSKGELVM